MLIWSFVTVLLVAYVPGALIFRLPVGDRQRRAALAAEERVFWGLLLSLALSSCIGLGLAAVGRYQFDRLLAVNGTVSVAILALVRGRLRLGISAPGPTWTALLPLGLVATGFSLNFFVPPAEYVIGGKDPGIYLNEGIQIAQRGTLVAADEVVRSLPAPYRGLFFQTHADDPTYYSNRFMGFFLLDPQSGTVVGQFPHLYPTWMAVAYGINGLNGAREVPGVWAIIGVLAVYFLGARLMGPAAAAAGAGLLAVHVVQIWNARYPNAEIVMQPLVFAGLLAYTRAQADDDGFFAPIAGLLLVLGLFTHMTAALAITAIAAAAVFAWTDRRPIQLSFWATLVVGTLTATTYLAVYLAPYFGLPLGFVRDRLAGPLPIIGVAVAALAGGVLLRWARQVPSTARNRWVSIGLVATVWALAGYAFFIRTATGVLASHDADSLRTFASFYLTPYGLAAALIGFALLACRFQLGAPFLLTATAFFVVFFYKIRIVPEHFWAARRFLAVTLPSSLLLVGAAAFYDAPWRAPSLSWLDERRVRVIRYAAGLAFVLTLGWHFLEATRPILHHVEYAGLIPRLEKLSARFGDDDLVLVESRGGSDTHVLALPLAYIYARNVLVLASVDPDKQLFREFLTWARTRYRRVFFVGGGGTELLSRTMAVEPIAGERFQIPEYESTLNAYPKGVKFKEFDISVYEFSTRPAPTDGFDLDVGASDDLFVRRFYAKERDANGFTFRWSRDVSYVSIVGTRPEQQTLTIWAAGAGRPAAAGPAEIEVFLNQTRLGAVTVGAGLGAYHFAIPPEVAAAVAQSEDAAQLRIMTRTWSPARLSGGGDTRDLGVMVDRIEIK